MQSPTLDPRHTPLSLAAPCAGRPRQGRFATALRRIAAWEWPTIGLLALVALLWPAALWLAALSPVLSVLVLVPVLTLHSSLSHEILHGHPVRDPRLCAALGLIQPGLFVPYLRFRAQHLAHHRDERLTDPYDDPESNYLDPAVWDSLPGWRRLLLRVNNTLAGRMLVGPAVGLGAFWRADAIAIVHFDRRIVRHWLAHLPGVALVLWGVSLSALPIWAYLLACYGALSVLKIRTFAEHRAHADPTARTVIIEDRGPLAFLFLNNNLHVIHHLHPRVPWYRLPRLYTQARGHFIAQNQGYVFNSYRDLAGRFWRRTKDPVAHPLWRPRRD